MPIQLSGSLVITGSITTTGVITMSGSIASASYSSNSDLLQGTGSVGFATTASLLEVSSSQQQISASYIALSASYNTFSGSASTRITVDSASLLQVSASQQQISASLLNVIAIGATTGSNSFRANQSITGSLVVSSTITAQTLVVQTVTSSIVYSSGSNIFGSQLSDRQTFTGSLQVTGSNHNIFGNVGIGATTFTAGNGTNLEVANSSIARVLVTQTGTRSFSLSAESNAFYLYDQTANATRLYVSASGYVGIGTTSPTRQLFVNDTVFFDNAGNGSTTNPSIAIGSTSLGISYLGGSNMALLTGGSTKMYISASGNVGIGTVSPDYPLTIQTNAAANSLKILGRSSGDTSVSWNSCNNATQYAHLDVGAAYFQIHTSNSQAIEFYTGGCERMRITCGGLVGIGTTSPLGTSGTEQTLHLSSGAANYATLYVTNSANSVKAIVAIQSSQLVGIFGMQSNHAALFATNDTERMRITACGTVKTQTNQALGALETCGTIANNNCVSLNLNSSGGNGSIGFIAIGAARTDTTACQAVRLYSHSHTNGFNTYTSIQGTNDGGITISDCVASGAQYIYNCSGATANYVVRYINLISLNSIFERQ